MAYWFTVHGPHPFDYDLAWHIYLQERYEELASDIEIGDRVFFYELKGSGKLHINQKIYATPVGKMGLVHIGKVTGKPYQRTLQTGMSETYGAEARYWKIGIPTDAGDSTGFVSRERVVSVLGYKHNYFFKGFARGAGIKQIDGAQANELQTLFEQSSRSPDEYIRTFKGAAKESDRYPDRVEFDGTQSPMNEIDEKTKGYVYILETKEIDLPVCKIGRTTRSPHKRCEEINKSSTGDFIWKVAHYIVVDNCKKLESLVHSKLLPLRQKGREFFNINADDAYIALTST